MTNPSEGWTRVPAILSFPDTPGFTETYGFAGASGKVWLEGQYLIPRERPSKTLYLFMHPSSTLQLLPMPAALVGAGLHVLCAASRYPKNDSGLIIEKAAIDMGLVSLAETFGLPASASGGIWLHRERSTGAMIRSPAGPIPTRRRKHVKRWRCCDHRPATGYSFLARRCMPVRTWGTVEAALASGRETA